MCRKQKEFIYLNRQAWHMQSQSVHDDLKGSLVSLPRVASEIQRQHDQSQYLMAPSHDAVATLLLSSGCHAASMQTAS